MKKYKKMAPLFSPIKIALSALCFAVAAVVDYLLRGGENSWTIILGGICAGLITVSLFAALPLGYSYSYSHFCAELSYLSVGYRKIRYDEYAAVFVSNASYNNGLGHGPSVSIQMQYKSKGKSKSIKTTYPFLTLIKSNYPIDQVRAGMYSRDLVLIDRSDEYCLGICWPGSLDELMEHTDMPVYVLEDVYLRFKGLFDATFAACAKKDRHIFIVTNQVIPYKRYLGS